MVLMRVVPVDLCCGRRRAQAICGLDALNIRRIGELFPQGNIQDDVCAFKHHAHASNMASARRDATLHTNLPSYTRSDTLVFCVWWLVGLTPSANRPTWYGDNPTGFECFTNIFQNWAALWMLRNNWYIKYWEQTILHTVYSWIN